MYWGKTLDQCTNQFCSTSIFSSLFSFNSDSSTQFNRSHPQSFDKEDVKNKDRLNELLSQKRSLKKSSQHLKSPQTLSVNTTSACLHKQNKMAQFQSPNKTINMKFPQQNVILRRPNNNISQNNYKANIMEPTMRKNISPSYKRPVSIKQTLRINQSPNIHYIPQNSSNTIRKQNCSPTYHIENNQTIRNHIKPSIQINMIEKQKLKNANSIKSVQIKNYNSPTFSQIKSQNINVFKSPKFTYESQIKKSQSPPNYMQRPTTSINTPNFTKIPKVTFQQHKKQISSQFPTIRQQNETYQQSKQLNDQSRQINPITFIDLLTKPSSQRNILTSMNNTYQFEQIEQNNNQGQQNHEQTFIEIIKNQQPSFQRSQQSSRIQVNNGKDKFQLSCEELLIQSQTKMKYKEQIQDIQYLKKMRSQHQAQVHRRNLHQPSICLKMIQNKLKGHQYQQSRSSSDQIYSQVKQSNLRSNENSNYNQSNHMPSKKQLDNQNLQQSNFSKIKKNKVNFNLQQKHHLLSQNTDRMSQNSLISGLTEQKQKSHKNNLMSNHNNLINNHSSPQQVLIHNNIMKQIGNLPHNLSDRELACSIKRICPDDKRVKTLINHKATMNSILYSDSIIKAHSQSQQNSFNAMSRYFSDENLNGILSSRQNVDRDQSTVIGRFTFNSSTPKIV